MENTVTVVADIRELSPILPDKLGHTTALKSEDVRVVVLTFPAGHTMKDHAAPKTLLLQALDGHLRVTAGGEVTDLLPGGIMRIEKLVRHEVEAVGESRLMLTLVG
ncbi:cupin domain-containing protein [Homoserinimonas sp. A447]